MSFAYYSTAPDYWRGVGEHYVNINGDIVDESGYVDLGLHFGGSPDNRVIW
jgi:hypothetical protein